MRLQVQSLTVTFPKGLYVVNCRAVDYLFYSFNFPPCSRTGRGHSIEAVNLEVHNLNIEVFHAREDVQPPAAHSD